ncbi:olfactory receptor 14C36-like [Alligator mississippiensis]|uniref:olfactory receptor 14C36-like n=1 Tax=Alligator mississippiensis TaxID=8496 RepID=UPI002877AA50|nr:olfactory receptor 14C36-like [Alligator mississippiensis]
MTFTLLVPKSFQDRYRILSPFQQAAYAKSSNNAHSVTWLRMDVKGNSVETTICYHTTSWKLGLLFHGRSADFSFLTFMAYDWYVAICKPLHYEIILNRRACIQMAASAWAAGAINSALHTGNTFSLPFCHSNIINQFFCEVPQLLKLSCSDTYRRELTALAFSVFLCLGCFIFIIVSYVQIFTAVWRIPSEQGRQKAFSTCIPHLTVVSLLLSTTSIAYTKPVSDSPSPLDLLAAVLYSVVPPLMNPVIYSMRNREIQAALGRKLLHRLIRSKNSLSIFLS